MGRFKLNPPPEYGHARDQTPPYKKKNIGIKFQTLCTETYGDGHGDRNNVLNEIKLIIRSQL